ncbi:hypothetical protein [Bdellovibrio svalbardensis]|uniref:Alanine and proline-rich secreted protein Apa n=1 Tax=Bdellovibrio svalbardensis TaxID=2972972 RepID=A0ABT6DE68_9BACT|nr:hypothetical protein [Bdellovibrio svalbardensis]MDG0815129.1 alanine and proline-rich secreted protein Apa [Bdellovibrio svalbardensis]
MLPMLHKHTIITAALMASLSLTACGSKKDIFTPPETPQQQTDSNKGETETGGTIGGNLPDPNSANNTEPPLPLPDYSDLPNPGQTPGSGQTLPRPLPETPKTPPPVADTRPSPALGTNPLPADYRSNDASNVGRDNLTKRMTGGVTADGLVYTSSSTDELLNLLRGRNERVDEYSRQANLQAAASVLSAKLTVDGMSGDAIVTLKVQEGRDVKVYNVAGGMSGEYASPLKSVRAGNGEKSTGQRAVEGTIKCLDLDGLCENTFVRLKIGTPGSSAIVNVVFRNSVADLYFNLPGKYSDNPEYLIMREFIRNTITQQNTDNKIKQARMSSFEVVNGRSGVALTMKGKNNELLGFSGPLLAPEAGTGVNITLSRIAKDQDDSLDLISLDKSQLTYANWIGDARMVANNGLGQVKIALKMRKRSNYGQDMFTVTFMRKIKPLVELTDDNLK